MTLKTLVVRKKNTKPDDEDKGWLVPAFSIDENQNIQKISLNDYQNGIFVSKSYSDIDSTFKVDELFLLEKHMLDEQRTQEKGINQYFSMGHHAKSLQPNVLIPIFDSVLPAREDGLFPIGIVPPNGIFFIRDRNEDKLYGPLIATKEEGNHYKALPKKSHFIRGLENDDIAVYKGIDLSQIILSTEVFGSEQYYLPSLKVLSGVAFEKYDYISDERLVTFFGNLEIGKNARLLARREAQKLKDGLKKQRKMNLVSSERLSRLESVIDMYLDSTDTGTDLVTHYLKHSDEGKEFLNSYVTRNQGSLLQEQLKHIKAETEREEQALMLHKNQLIEQIEEKRIELNKLHEYVSSEQEKAQESIKDIRKGLELDIEEARSQTDEEIQNIFAEQQQEKQKEIDLLEQKLKELDLIALEKNEELEKLSNEVKEFADIKDLYEKKIILEHEKKTLDRAVETHTETLEDPIKLAQSMAQVKLVNDILNGRKLTSSPTVETVPPIELSAEQPLTPKKLIEKISAYFEDDGGKTFSNDEIANIMISMTQSFLTILSGPPGIGKTSTVIRLAQSLNLGGVDGQQNFIYIPVGRGWVSSRDILGFYNSLRDSYQPARTGLYEFLKRNECQGYSLSPRLVLLDEANLSSMEHYWSDFLGMCDNEGRFRALDTGHPERDKGLLNVANNVRFIATINNDSTTERLSPRLIDRAAVITLDMHSTQAESIVDFEKLHGALSYQVLEDFFIPKQDDSINSSDDEMLKKLLSTLQEIDSSLGQPIHISPRKVQIIRNYCAVASKIMETEEALDFAIAQHILPHIEGFGTNFRARLEKFRDDLGNQYPRSKRLLERILSSGSDFTNSYSFF